MAQLDDDDNDDGSEQGSAQTGGGERERSGTRYPFYDLAGAEVFVKAVEECGGNEVLEDDLLKHLGVSRTTKSWIYRLSTAREFGLVERKGQKSDARLMITDLGKRILRPGDDDELAASRMAAFLTPALYKKLFEHYKGSRVPQAKFLANVLVRDHKLVDSVAEPAAEAFISTAKFAGLINAQSNVLDDAKKGDRRGDAAPPPAPTAPLPDAARQTMPIPGDFIAHTFPLRRDLTVTIPLPISLTKKDVGRLKAWMDSLVMDDDEPKLQEVTKEPP
jgi:hypothetical protein